MENLYKSLGFKPLNILENPYGIKIYKGTKGEDDWCIEIPKELIHKKLPHYKFDKNVIIEFVSEKHVLMTAEEYTRIAKQ